MKRKLQITGRGKLSVTPDVAILSFDAEAHEWEYEKTIDALNNKVEQLRVIVEEEDIERKSLKTKDFGVRKSTTWSKTTEKSEFNGFLATHRLELEIPIRKSLINNLLSRIARNLNNIDFTIAFGVHDPAEHQQQLLLLAISKAKQNASIIAEATGVELKEILTIDYSYQEISIRSRHYDYSVYEANLTTADASPDLEPDDIDVTETVTITWEIL